MNQEQVALSQKEEKPTHVPLQQKIDFDLLFSHREMRRSDHSGTISYKGCCYRPAEGYLDLDFKRKKFEVRETHCEKLFLVHEKGLVEMDKVEKPAPPGKSNTAARKETTQSKAHKPAPDHPRKGFSRKTLILLQITHVMPPRKRHFH